MSVNIELNNNILAGRGYVDTMRKLDIYEKLLGEDGFCQIDFDIAPTNVRDTSRPILSRDQAYYRLEDLKVSVNPEQSEGIDSDGDLVGAKINSAQAVLVALDRGHVGDLEDYLTDTMNVQLKELPGTVLERQLDEVTKRFAEIDPNLSKLGYSAAGWERLKLGKLTNSEVQLSTERMVQDTIKILSSIVGTRFKIPYKSEFEETDEPWLFWVDGDRTKWRLRMNQHSRHSEKWIRGVEQRLGSHEATHIVHGWALRRNLDTGMLTNPAYGITTVPGPEQWGMEGLADTIPLWVPEIYELFDVNGRFFYSHQLLNRMVGNNVHTKIVAGDTSDNELRDYIRHYLRGESDEDISKFLSSRREGFKYPSYWGAYEDGTLRFMAWAEKLKEHPSQKDAFLQLCFERQFTKPQYEVLFLGNGDNGSNSDSQAA